MAIILDTDVIVQGERATFELEDWLASRPNDQFEVAGITVAELWHGVERATRPHRAARERYVRAILDTFPIIPYTEQTAYVHAQIWAELEAAGKMIGYYDLIVGATDRAGAGQSGGHFQQAALRSDKRSWHHRTKVVPTTSPCRRCIECAICVPRWWLLSSEAGIFLWVSLKEAGGMMVRHGAGER